MGQHAQGMQRPGCISEVLYIVVERLAGLTGFWGKRGSGKLPYSVSIFSSGYATQPKAGPSFTF